MALWANLHSSFVIGLLIAAALGLEALLDVRAWRWRTLLGWAAFLALSWLATLATPHGLDGLTFPLKVLDMKTLAVITEWQGPDFLKWPPTSLEIALLAGVLVAFWRGVRLSAVRGAHPAGPAAHEPAACAPGGAARRRRAADPGRAARPRAGPRRARDHGPADAGAAGRARWSLALLAIAVRLLVPEVRVDGPTAPITALAHVPAALRAQPVLNDYDFGGYLIFEGVRPYIDGRADMYGDAFVADDDQIQRASQSAMDAAIARYHIRWAILSPNRPLTDALARTPGWKRTYADRYAVVLVKAGADPPPAKP